MLPAVVIGLSLAATASAETLSCAGGLTFPGGAAACRAYSGSGWTGELAAADCKNIPGASGGELVDAPCSTSGLVGTCVVAAGEPMQSDLHFYGGDASALETMCTAFLGGQWSSQPAPTGPPPVDDILLDEALSDLNSDSVVTVSPNACNEACLADLLSSRGAIEFTPTEGVTSKVGVIYLPGGLVDPRAYSVFARKIATGGYFTAIIPFPGNLPITDPFRPTATIAKHPEIATWVLAGHSLGGSTAAIYAAADPLQKISGLAFLASYPPDDIDFSQSDLSVLSVAATEDGVVNKEAYEEAKVRLPRNTTFEEIRGGNHEQFGYYIRPDGVDGQPFVSRFAQHTIIGGDTFRLLSDLE